MADQEQQGLGHALSIGVEILAGVLIGLYSGLWLEKRYGWAPWGSLIGAMLGFAAGMYLVIKQAMKINKD